MPQHRSQPRGAPLVSALIDIFHYDIQDNQAVLVARFGRVRPKRDGELDHPLVMRSDCPVARVNDKAQAIAEGLIVEADPY